MSLESNSHSDCACPASMRRDLAGERPDRDRLFTWLSDQRVLRPDGQVLSWHNPSHPGYPYPEATALWLSWAAWRHQIGEITPATPAVRSVAAWLVAQLGGRGSIGRGHQRFLFDTCLAVHALTRACKVPGLLHLDPGSVPGLAKGVDAFLDADLPVLPPPAAPPRWSERWNGHLLRAAALLMQAGESLDHAPTIRTAQRIADRCAPLDGQGPTYLHALCYQAEGQLLLGALGHGDQEHAARQTAATLAELQRPDGLLPGWSHLPDPARSDTTAQAVRLWTMVDPRHYEAPRRAAMAALARAQHSRGAMPYEPGSSDLNSWVAVFTDQAICWSQRGADILALI
jgi:hypothetical protein